MSLRSNLQVGQVTCQVVLFKNLLRVASLCLPQSQLVLPRESSSASLHHIDCIKTRLRSVSGFLVAYLFIVLFDLDGSPIHGNEQLRLSLKYSVKVVHFMTVDIDLEENILV